MTLNKLLISAAALVLSAGMAFAQSIQIEQPYARVSSPIAKTGAAFMHIMNMGDEDDQLIAVTTDIAKMPQLHTHIMEDGVAMMREVEGGFEIPAKGATILERGGLHIMLMGLTKSLVQDEMITLTLIFEKAGEITIEVQVDNQRQGNMEMGAAHDHTAHDHSASTTMSND